MKPLLLSFVFALTSCSSNSYLANHERSLASTSTKIRFFETKIEDNKIPSKLACDKADCRYLEIEIVNNFLSINSCEVSRHSLFDGVSPEVSTKASDLKADCDEILSGFEITPQVLKSLEEQLAKKNLKTKSPTTLLRAGSQTIVGGVATVLMGALSVVSASTPLVLIVPVGTVAYAGYTINGAKDFVKEFKGKPLPINHSASVKQLETAASKSGVSVFYIGTAQKGFNQGVLNALAPDNFDRFIVDWKRFTYKLEALKNAQYEQNNYFDGYNFPI